MVKRVQAIRYAKQGEWKEALAIFKRFRYEITKDEKRIIEIAHECLTGGAGFYAQLGVNGDAMIQQAQQIITNKYL